MVVKKIHTEGPEICAGCGKVTEDWTLLIERSDGCSDTDISFVCTSCLDEVYPPEWRKECMGNGVLLEDKDVVVILC